MLNRSTTTVTKRKGMPTLCCSSSPNNLSYSSPSFSRSRSCSASIRTTFALLMKEESIQNAESIINKWDPDSTSYTKLTYLFRHSRKEAKELLKSVKDLRHAMENLVGEGSASRKLVHAQNLMQMAMKRLQKEFYQILFENHDHLDPESVSSCSRSSGRSGKFDDEDEAGTKDDLPIVGESVTEVERVSALAMSDLKSIADCMIMAGYGQECMKMYKTCRKSIVDWGLYRLGIQRFKACQIQKMDSEALEVIIKHWIHAVKVAVKTLFRGEKVLCDHVFSASETARESCFYEIIKEGATTLFGFLELIAKIKKPERIFCLMELYKAVSDVWVEIESIFNSKSTSPIKIQALLSWLKLSDSVRHILSDFGSTIRKDSSKVPVGGGIHPLTQSVMNYVSSLAGYHEIASDILADYPPLGNSHSQETFFKSSMSDDGSAPAVSAWLIFVLLCKLDSKAEHYKDVALSYLFLANNLRFIVEKVQHTPNLQLILGAVWVSQHTKKVKLYASNYESAAWKKVFSALPEKSSEISPKMAKECFRRFKKAFEKAYRKHTTWVVEDRKLRDDLKASIAEKLVPTYKEFHDTYSVMLSGGKKIELGVRFSPDDLGNYLTDLFHGT